MFQRLKRLFTGPAHRWDGRRGDWCPVEMAGRRSAARVSYALPYGAATSTHPVLRSGTWPTPAPRPASQQPTRQPTWPDQPRR